MFTPPFVRLLSADTAVMLRELRQAGVDFPVVCKAQEAHGSSEAHRMMIIFNAGWLTVHQGAVCGADVRQPRRRAVQGLCDWGEVPHCPAAVLWKFSLQWYVKITRCFLICENLFNMKKKIYQFFLLIFFNLSSHVLFCSFFYVFIAPFCLIPNIYSLFLFISIMWHVGLWHMPVRCRSPSHCIWQSEYYWLTVAGRSAGHSSADRRQLRPGRSHGHAGPRNCHFHRQGSAEAIRLVLNWNWFDRGQNDRPLRDYRRQCFSQYVTHRLIDWLINQSTYRSTYFLSIFQLVDWLVVWFFLSDLKPIAFLRCK